MKLRLSWSKLNNWANYSKQDCINSILGYPVEVGQAAKDGQDCHKYIEENRLFFLEELEPDLSPNMVIGQFHNRSYGYNYDYEVKGVVSIYDWLDFSYVVDYRIEDKLVDWKTGKSKDRMQLYIYALLLSIERDIKINKGMFVPIKWDGKEAVLNKRAKIDRFDIGPAELEYAFEFINKNAREIRSKLISMGL